MPILSLGLLKDEREHVASSQVRDGRKDLVPDVEPRDNPSDRTDTADSWVSSRDGSQANHPLSTSKGADNGTDESGALPNHPLPSFDPAPSNGRAGEGTHP